MSKTNKNLVLVGRIAKAHGVRGEVSLNFFADSPSVLDGEVFLQKGDAAPYPIKIKERRGHHGSMLLSFVGVTSRNESELLRGAGILVDRSKLPPVNEDEAYLADMLGLEVIVQEDGKTFSLGYIENIDAPAGQELWEIITHEGQEVLLPAVPEFVLDIDLDKEQAIITPPPGLLDIYLTGKDKE